jgi:hypothetical protein
VVEHRAHFLPGLAVDLVAVVEFEAVAGGQAACSERNRFTRMNG